MDNKFYQTFCAQGILSPTLEVGPALIFGLGLAGESGEVADIIKKQFGYGRKPDLNICLKNLEMLCGMLQIYVLHTA